MPHMKIHEKSLKMVKNLIIGYNSPFFPKIRTKWWKNSPECGDYIGTLEKLWKIMKNYEKSWKNAKKWWKIGQKCHFLVFLGSKMTILGPPEGVQKGVPQKRAVQCGDYIGKRAPKWPKNGQKWPKFWKNPRGGPGKSKKRHFWMRRLHRPKMAIFSKSL